MARIVGGRITEARQLAGMSCADLAEQIGVSTRELICMEAGRVQPTTDQTFRICRMLDTPLGRFHMPMPPDPFTGRVFFCSTEGDGT